MGGWGGAGGWALRVCPSPPRQGEPAAPEAIAPLAFDLPSRFKLAVQWQWQWCSVKMWLFFFFSLFHTPSLSCVRSATHNRTNTAEQNKLDNTHPPLLQTAKGCGVLGVCHLLRVCVPPHVLSGSLLFLLSSRDCWKTSVATFVCLLSASPIEFVCYLANGPPVLSQVWVMAVRSVCSLSSRGYVLSWDGPKVR